LFHVMTTKERLFLFCATGFGLGWLPKAPGTWGSLLGLLGAYGLGFLSIPTALLCLGLFIVLSIWISDKSEIALGRKDASQIVIDEIAGMMVALVGLSFSVSTYVSAFILFRLFDIVKPFPIKRVEQAFSGGVGIVADDLVAALYARVLLEVLLRMQVL
jgi:phosphatidylglycerophosphatase A